MNKILKDALLMLVAGTFAVSCADYNETDNFTAQPDPTVTTPYNDLNPVKSYINRGAYPNMSLDAALNIKDFKEQALAHAAAVANFDRFYFGTAFMSGSIINAKGVLNFIDMKEQLDHVQEIGGEVYGSAIAANTGQADGWLSYLTAPVERMVRQYSKFHLSQLLSRVLKLNRNLAIPPNYGLGLIRVRRQPLLLYSLVL